MRAVQPAERAPIRGPRTSMMGSARRGEEFQSTSFEQIEEGYNIQFQVPMMRVAPATMIRQRRDILSSLPHIPRSCSPFGSECTVGPAKFHTPLVLTFSGLAHLSNLSYASLISPLRGLSSAMIVSKEGRPRSSTMAWMKASSLSCRAEGRG